MCDYSQQLRRHSRPAMVGDELEMIALGGWGRGFAKHWRGRWLLTCLRHGTEIVFDRRQVLQQCHSFIEHNGERFMVNDILPREARTMVGPGAYGGDALEFSNGLVCGLSAIALGARIRVLQVPAPRRRKRKQVLEVTEPELEVADA